MCVHLDSQNIALMGTGFFTKLPILKLCQYKILTTIPQSDFNIPTIFNFLKKKDDVFDYSKPPLGSCILFRSKKLPPQQRFLFIVYGNHMWKNST